MRHAWSLSLSLIGPLLSLSANAIAVCNTAIPETTPTSAFTFHTGGTVTDTRTGLEWKRCLEGQTFGDNGTPDVFTDDTCAGTPMSYTWQGALSAAATAAGDGWRLPNVNELASIVEWRCSSPAANLAVFPSLGNDVLWSSSPFAANAGAAWYQYFDIGVDGAGNRNDNNRVRLVRAGQ
jgi:hypothetical protein